MLDAGFFSAVRGSLFGGRLSQSQVDGLEVLATEWDSRGESGVFGLSYVLPTAYHETGCTMQPVAVAANVTINIHSGVNGTTPAPI